MSTPWQFQNWAFEQTTGSVARKAVLSNLATMADSETGRCQAKQSTIAKAVELQERSVRTHLAALESAGFIARRRQTRRDGSRRCDEYLMLAPWVTEWPDGEPVKGQPASIAGSQPANLSTSNRHEDAGQEQPPMNGYSSDEEYAQQAALDIDENDRPSRLIKWHAEQVVAVHGEGQRPRTPSVKAREAAIKLLRSEPDGTKLMAFVEWALRHRYWGSRATTLPKLARAWKDASVQFRNEQSGGTGGRREPDFVVPKMRPTNYASGG